MLKTLTKKLIETLFVEHDSITNQTNLIEKEIVIAKRLILDISFAFRESLIYHVNNKERLRLYILSALKQKIFKQVHNLFNHKDYHRYYDRLSYTIFIRHLINRLREYIVYYSICQLNQTKRYKLYDSLVLVIALIILFYILTINFIIALPSTISENNYLLIITYKTIKRIILISKKKL